MNSFKKNPNLNFILGKGGVGGEEERGGARFSDFFYKESKPKI